MRLPPPPRHPSLLSQLRGSGLGLPCPIWQVRGEPKACQNVGGISNPAADRQRLGSPLIRGEAAQQRESLPRRHQDPRDRTRRPAQAWDAHALYRTAWGGGRTPSPRRGPPPPQRTHCTFPSHPGEPRGQTAGVYTACSGSGSPWPRPAATASAVTPIPVSARVVCLQHNPMGSGPSPRLSR